jgi:tetraacyldisaccharide 4'-kinase
VGEDRVAAINRIREEHPEVNLIIMDDGFQHRRVRAKVNIVILDATRPVKNDRLLPLGRLRDLKRRLKAAHIFMVSKCSESMSPLDRRLWRNELRTIAYQTVYFSHIVPMDIEPLFYFDDREDIDYGNQAIILAGVGNPRPFVNEAAVRFNIVDKMIMPDHHRYTRDDMAHLMEKLRKYPRAIVLMTEKDAVKLFRSGKHLPEALRRAMYYQPIETQLIDGPDKDFVGNLKREIEFKDFASRKKQSKKKVNLDDDDTL